MSSITSHALLVNCITKQQNKGYVVHHTNLTRPLTSQHYCPLITYKENCGASHKFHHSSTPLVRFAKSDHPFDPHQHAFFHPFDLLRTLTTTLLPGKSFVRSTPNPPNDSILLVEVITLDDFAEKISKIFHFEVLRSKKKNYPPILPHVSLSYVLF